MKIGDKVSFLSETGGGRVVGFQGKNIVLVEDEDGFQIPTRINDVVVEASDDYSMGKMVSQKKSETIKPDTRSIKERLADNEVSTDEPDSDPADGYEPQLQERKGGDRLSVYIAFVPTDPTRISETTFDTYIVNDSNYYIHYILMRRSGNSLNLNLDGEVEPNTKVYLETFGRDELNERERSLVQLLAYKREKPFLAKDPISVEFKLDPVKFYKLNTFRENDFFEQRALVCTIVENDRPAKTINLNPDDIKDSLYERHEPQLKSPARTNPQAEHHDKGLERRYTADQSKSRKVKQLLHDDKIVIDLHADSLLETTAGMQPSDILEYQLDAFRHTLEQYKDKKGQKIIFIHGKGEGVLRHALIHELNYRYKSYPYQDASFREYGYGATQVTIK